MRLALKLLLGFVFATLCFSLGCVYQSFKLSHQFPVEITIQNQLGESINNINLTFKSGINGTLSIPHLEDGKLATLKYHPWSEGSFVIEANLQSGKKISYRQGYVEAGYSFNWVVTNNTLIN